jgi:DNA-binding MarR family transcriptional regulator/GNAT superfamily N-acetyltransferase
MADAGSGEGQGLGAAIGDFRRFNRLYTRWIGTLEEGYLRTGYSLAEGRVIYELATRGESRAKDIAAALGLDPGYLSRILARFGRAGLVRRSRGRDDGRAADLRLTPRGRAAFATLNRRADEQARGLLSPLPAAGRTRLLAALRTAEEVALERPAAAAEGAPAFTLRTHRAGDMGTVIASEGAGYAAQFGWDTSFEALVARITADFLDHFDAARERCWIAEIEGRHAGHIFLVRHPEQAGVAKLRLLFVEPHARGLGLGQRLVGECIAFAREAGYRKVTLWTQSCLGSARKIYVAAGFRRVKEEAHHSFGHDLVAQTWDLDLV